MFDDMITKIFEAHRRVANETEKYVKLEISPIMVEILVFESDKLSNDHTAYLHNDFPDITTKALENILDVLTSMLKGGAVDV